MFLTSSTKSALGSITQMSAMPAFRIVDTVRVIIPTKRAEDSAIRSEEKLRPKIMAKYLPFSPTNILYEMKRMVTHSWCHWEPPAESEICPGLVKICRVGQVSDLPEQAGGLLHTGLTWLTLGARIRYSQVNLLPSKSRP